MKIYIGKHFKTNLLTRFELVDDILSYLSTLGAGLLIHNYPAQTVVYYPNQSMFVPVTSLKVNDTTTEDYFAYTLYKRSFQYAGLDSVQVEWHDVRELYGHANGDRKGII